MQLSERQKYVSAIASRVETSSESDESNTGQCVGVMSSCVNIYIMAMCNTNNDLQMSF